MKKSIYLFAIILILGICSCEKYVQHKKVENLVKEWTGKTIVFDTEIPCISVMQDTICSNINNKPYKIRMHFINFNHFYNDVFMFRENELFVMVHFGILKWLALINLILTISRSNPIEISINKYIYRL
jgi:hypothetical protein